ncbi:hypothetical protein CJF30_00005080 [Rutstroemia sp. NJR-2017a BBW]|nr:hypothetical protein CJF30_00005080 [Rutstroemia sp. NJR-2017a BBW]
MSGAMEKTKVKAKEVAWIDRKEDYEKARQLAESAAVSGAYLYPIKARRKHPQTQHDSNAKII